MLPNAPGRACLATAVFTVALLAAGSAPPSSAEPAPSRSRPSLDQRPMRGVTLGLFYPEDRAHYPQSLDRIAALGATHVSVLIPVWQQSVASAAPGVSAALTPPDTLLLALARAAHARSLKVMFFPLLHLEDSGPGLWRGTLRPPSWSTWFESYTSLVVHYARLAREADVEWLCVGAELGSSERHLGRWDALIDSVRAAYGGRLLYSRNWDRPGALAFAPRLDLVGTNAYFELGAGDSSNAGGLRRRWAPIRRRLVARRQPILFTEVGYPSSGLAVNRPWDYIDAGEPRPDLQAVCFDAFFGAWDGCPGLLGSFVYLWSAEEGGSDAGYSIRDKPAERIVANWYARGFPASRRR